MLRRILAIGAVMLVAAVAKADNPKHEFRGAWMHTVYQAQYAQKGTQELQEYLRDQLDKLQSAGVNAVLFQVRPSADAFYASRYEPWSRFLTKDGNAPNPYWDPLQFMIDESHARGMELHAWLNPYRVTTSPNEKLAPNHIYHKEPWRFVVYEGDDKMYFDPGLPENRKFIEDVVMDIVNRYDVDGIHFDDYFYPYPAKGKDFPDDASYAKYGNGMKRDDWRRHNVDLLIEEIHNDIVASKPWVRFGISPFGIWRNKTSDPRGSDTAGLQNYDALYADVLPWAEKGWIDYLLPQLYWELEHKRASTLVLADWWNDNAGGRHMYFGQDVGNIMKHADLPPSTEKTQLRHKIEISRNLPNVQGNCWWPGYSVTANVGGVADSLSNNLQNTVALVPEYPWMTKQKPSPVTVAPVKPDGMLRWTAGPKPQGAVTDVNHYVVYRFPLDVTHLDFTNPEFIYKVTYNTSLQLTEPGRYFVTALNRANIESNPGNGSAYRTPEAENADASAK